MIFEKNRVLDLINSELTKRKYGNSPAELYDPISYILSLGGKRLRPFLTLFSNYLYQDNYTVALKPALAIEVFHNFTLMHDDIMDKAPLRRNKVTVHEKWNNNIAILSGDVMLVKAYDLLLDVEKDLLPETLRLFNKCAAEVCEGQQLDMNFEKRANVSEEEYLNMIKLKTAVLLGLSMRIGALIGGASKEDADKLEAFGVNIGMGFQLMDDLLDVYGDQKKFGKMVGGDIAANKKTFLYIKALELSRGETKKLLLKSFESGSGSKDKVKSVTHIYDKLNIRSVTEEKINLYFQTGLKKLSLVNAPIYKKNMLKEFVITLMTREN
ncbi:MAG: polyprenyl synthetase family protein [Cytophagaceae bacterium]